MRMPPKRPPNPASPASAADQDAATAHLRQAVVDDAPVLHRLLKALAAFHGPETAFWSTPEAIARDGFGPEARYESWLAEVQGEPVGVATFFLTYSTFKAQACLHLDNLFVEPAFRGRGVARQLLERVRTRAQELRCVRVDLHVYATNPARQVYERFGFEHTSDAVYTLNLHPRS